MAKRFPLYQRLLRLYPASYRKKYADQMLQTLGDMLDDQPSKAARVLVWSRVITELPLSIAGQNIITLGGTMSTTPQFVKRNTILGSALIVPFFVTVIVNSFSQQVFSSGSTWHYPAMASVVYLPVIATLLLLGTFMSWLYQKKKRDNIGFWRSLLDVKHNWLMLVVGGLALLIVAFVFGHDSVGCSQRDPIQLDSNSRLVLQSANVSLFRCN
jgi:hypothetical protein